MASACEAPGQKPGGEPLGASRRRPWQEEQAQAAHGDEEREEEEEEEDGEEDGEDADELRYSLSVAFDIKALKPDANRWFTGWHEGPDSVLRLGEGTSTAEVSIGAKASHLSPHVISFLERSRAHAAPPPQQLAGAPPEPSRGQQPGGPMAGTGERAAELHDGVMRCKMAGCRFRPNTDVDWQRRQPSWVGYCCGSCGISHVS